MFFGDRSEINNSKYFEILDKEIMRKVIMRKVSGGYNLGMAYVENCIYGGTWDEYKTREK